MEFTCLLSRLAQLYSVFYYGGNMNQYFLLFKSIEFQVMTK